jgi:hypothetical protein
MSCNCCNCPRTTVSTPMVSTDQRNGMTAVVQRVAARHRRQCLVNALLPLPGQQMPLAAARDVLAAIGLPVTGAMLMGDLDWLVDMGLLRVDGPVLSLPWGVGQCEIDRVFNATASR